MATNPMYGSKISPSNNTAPTNPLNEKRSSIYQGRNTFDYSRSSYLTARYADITPFECIHAVEGDVLELGSKHNIRSLTLKSPIYSTIDMKKTYTMVDMKAILPRNWNRFYINPTNGDDVVASDVNTFCNNFFFNFLTIKNNLITYINQDHPLESIGRVVNTCFHTLLVFESVFSSGSLLPMLGFHTNAMCVTSFDKSFENLTSILSRFSYSVTYTYIDESQNFAKRTTVFPSERFRDLINFIRSHHSFSIKLSNPTEQSYDEIAEAFVNFFDDFDLHTSDEHRTPLNYDSLIAYQISVASFYSRDSLDNVFSAETYRDVMDSLWSLQAEASNWNINEFYYRYNGNKFLYDAVSGYTFSRMLSKLVEILSSSSFDYYWEDNAYSYYYFMNIFAFGQNLRFGDYFTGSRPTPLAIGDVNAEVTSDGVNAIDMTVAIARARFFHDTNSIGRRPEDYINDLMDGNLPPEITEPRRLVTLTSSVSGFEVENTASNQGDIVTLLRSSNSNKVYSLAVGHPCIILGLVTFEIKRVYSRTVDRFFLHEDRFDMFNKYLQKIGDQGVLRGELDASYDTKIDDSNFSYTGRHMEYKQRFPIASGGFIDFLPGYLFITDPLNSDGSNVNELFPNLDSDYLRSTNYELDKFYSSLTNYSLAGYFHFIIGFTNVCIAHRKMDYKPSIF